MNVSTDLFSIASQSGRSEMAMPSKETLLRLNVINNGVKPTKWTIESITGATYLKGEQETWIALNKFMLVCPAANEPILLYAIFDSGQNAEEVMSLFGAGSLVIDGNPTPLDSAKLRRKNDHGKINVFYPLNRDLLDKIAAAKRVGVALQTSPEAASFAGFDNMPFEEGAKRLPGFLDVCGRGRLNTKSGTLLRQGAGIVGRQLG